MSTPDFVHLHNHTEFSLLDGAARVNNMIEKAAALNMPAAAITDHGTMFGVIDFYRAAARAGIKPVIGCEVYMAQRHRRQKEPRLDDSPYHLLLLARNNQGYRNLMQLVSRGFTEGFYYKPRIDRELLEAYSEGIIALSACLGGEIPTLIMRGQEEKAFETARYFRNLFGEENFFLELHNHGLAEQKQVNRVLYEISKEEGIELVATNDVHYLERQDAVVHDVLLCIQTGTTLEESGRMRFDSQEYFFKNQEEMAAAFPEHPAALKNTSVIAAKCHLDFDFDQRHLPEYTLPANTGAKAYLEELCRAGLKKRYPEVTAELEERLSYELGVIDQMEFNNYFLIVWDLIDYAKKNEVLVGPGRGSAAGSLVAYCLGITNIEPLRYGLLFERFLNPERISMPDIDIDFCDDKRDRVINYVAEKYGQEKVAQIITFGTMAARAAVRDVGRAMAIPYAEVDKIAKMIPQELKVTIKKALGQSRELKEAYQKDELYKKLLDTSMAVEGMVRHASTHAAGVVIAREPLVNYVPLYKTADSSVVTQFTMETLEDLGLLKMDLLGLKTLSIIGVALENIKKRQGLDVDIENIAKDDTATYELLADGDTTGIFQLESTGMRSILRDLVPDKFEDIIAVVALFRPGPMEQIPVFVKSKQGRKKIKYAHRDLEPILNETYGVMVYQEQVMQIANKMAGFSLGQADLLRRAIGKKNLAILDEQRELFVAGCVENGYSEPLANEIYALILKFASYGFNKSHAAAYAMIAYQTAYLKAHWPVEYMAALMTVYCDNSAKVALYIADCRRMGIEIMPPDINESDTYFTVVGEKRIRFGLAAVKNVGLGAIESIVKARAIKPFASLSDFASRVDMRQCNRRALESLIKCGAFDSLKGHRAQYLAIMDDVLAQGQSLQKDRENGQISMIALMDDAVQEEYLNDRLLDIEPFSDKERLVMEKEMLGLFISGHPVEPYRALLDGMHNLVRCAELNEVGDNKQVRLAGVVLNVRKLYTRKNKEMAFVTLEDLTGSVELVIFPDLYEKRAALLAEDNLLVAEGRTDQKEEENAKLIVQNVSLLAKEKKAYRLLIKKGRNRLFLEDLKNTLFALNGEVPVYLYFEGENKLMVLGEEYWVKGDDFARRRLEDLLGPGALKEQDKLQS